MKKTWLIVALLFSVFLTIVVISIANPFSFSVKQTASNIQEKPQLEYHNHDHDHDMQHEDEALASLDYVSTYQYDSKQSIEEFMDFILLERYQDALSKFSLERYVDYVADSVKLEQMDYMDQLSKMSKGNQIESYQIDSKKKKNGQDVYPVTIFYQDGSSFSYEYHMTREIDAHTGKFYWVIDEDITEILKKFP